MYEYDQDINGEVSKETVSTKKQRPFLRVLAGLLIVSLFFGFGMGIGLQFGPERQGVAYDGEPLEILKETLTSIQTLEKPISDRNNVEIVQKVAPSVVAITSTVDVQNFYSSYESEGKGSGVIYETTGESVLIITNHHVIDKAKNVSVEFFDGTIADATLMGSDAETDLALIKVASEDLPTQSKLTLRAIEIGDSNALLLGESVMALGNALGYGQSVTVGVVSALNRSLRLLQGDMALIQTDAAINPGNSGGALVNSMGQLVGINTAKIASQNVEGMGFSIPVHVALPIVESLKEKGYISRPYLGIYGKDVDENLSDLYELPMGVVIMDLVPESGAYEAKLEKGDVIVKIDNTSILTMEDLTNHLKNYEVGDTIDVTVIRDGKSKLRVPVVLKEK
jgi:serine protease Do